MSDLLQRHLQLQAEKQNNLKLLESQWSFDKQLIPKVLQQVAQLFPHYSRHDQSHSEQILVNVERLLGEQRISMLSATDTWLLLESAYWHDIGMVVPHKALKEALDSSDFKIYKENIAGDISHELQSFAKYFDGDDLTKVFSGAENPLDAVRKFRLLMAEWFRRQHPTRSEKSVNDPWNELGLSSPRTELIPKRLYRILGRVCALHGASFEDVLAQLPHKEVGMSNDDCHPRFIACLLRLGDLLDMDDNRFCPVMQRIAGERPALSKAHEDKHSSIRHFRLDSDRIEISAVCDSVDGYLEQWRWLNYLRDEMQCQMGRWQDIAPSAALGLLPTLGEIKVDISGRQLIAKPGERPEFTLNSERIMRLLQGENLYRKTDSIRELLQNAVDATLLRVWIESQREGAPIPSTPHEAAGKYFKRYPISIKIEKEEIINSDSPIDKIRWKFTLLDKGIGISQEDLNCIMSVGSSSKNSRKQMDMRGMPEWFKPSGTFGIGLQSVFMWADVVMIETKNLHSQEGLNISLHSPSGEKRGLVTIELADNFHYRDVGTKLSFVWTSERHPKRFSISESQEMTSAAYRTFDDLLDGELPLDALNVCDEIKKFSAGSFIDIACELKIPGKESFNFSSENNLKDFSLDFYDETNSKFDVFEKGKYQNRVYFRGQSVEDAKISSYYLFDYSIDLYSGRASEYLTFSRNNISSEGRDEIDKLVRRNLLLWASKNVESNKFRELISLLAEFWKNIEDAELTENQELWNKVSLQLGDSWKDLPCLVWAGRSASKESAFRKELSAGNYIFFGHDSRDIKFYLSRTERVFYGYYQHLEIYAYCAKSWCQNRLHGIRYVMSSFGKKSSREKCVLMQLVTITENQSRLEVEPEALVFSMERSIKNISRGIRLLIPLSVFPTSLELDGLILNNSLASTRFSYVLPWVPDVPVRHILLPFEVKTNERYMGSVELERLDEFLQFAHSNLEKKMDIAKVRELYMRLISYIDNDLMKDSADWKAARKTKNPAIIR